MNISGVFNPTASPTPRVAASSDDLRVGGRILWQDNVYRSLWRDQVVNPATIKHVAANPQILREGRIVVLSDPAPEPVTVSRAAYDALASHLVAGMEVSSPGSLIWDIRAVVDEVEANG